MTTRLQVEIAAEGAQANPVWLWPNLLSFDAPIVAVVWQTLFAYSFRAKFDGLAATLLVLSVWIIYVADRLLDAWRNFDTQPRHKFHRNHWRAIATFWVVTFAATAWLAWTRLPTPLFVRGLIVLAGVAIYFGITHLFKKRWPKELAVAVLFAVGTSLTTWGQVQGWIDIASIVTFGMLCWINCAAIEKWEKHGLDHWPVRGASIAVGLFALIFLYDHRPIIGGAETACAFAFVMLDRAQTNLSVDALRVLADVALLTPILFLPVIGLRT